MLTASGEKDLRVSCSICHIKAGIPFYSTTFFLRMQKLYHNPNKWWSKNQTKPGVCQPCKPLVAFATAHFYIRDQSSGLAHCGAAQMPARNSSSKETAVGLRAGRMSLCFQHLLSDSSLLLHSLLRRRGAVKSAVAMALEPNPGTRVCQHNMACHNMAWV